MNTTQKEIGQKIEEGIKKISEDVEEIVKEFHRWIIETGKEVGVDIVKELKAKGVEYNEDVIRKSLWGLVIQRIIAEKLLGRTLEEHYLIEEDGLTPEEARYVVNNPCLTGPPEKCDYYRTHGTCGPCCTNYNGWLFIKTSPEGKIRPNWKALAELPKDTLFINKPIDEQGLDSKLKDFLEKT